MLFGEIWTGRHLQRLYKTFGIRAPETRVTLAPEIQPTYAIETDTPEYEILGGERLIAAENSVGAVAAQFGFCDLTIPATVGALAVIDWLNVSGAAAFIGWVAAAAGNPITPTYRDARLSRPSVGVCPTFVSITNGTVAASGILGKVLTLPNNGLIQNPLIVISPGQVLRIVSQTVNVAMDFNVMWREREADPLELNVNP